MAQTGSAGGSNVCWDLSWSSDYKRFSSREAVTARPIRRQLEAARWTDLQEIVRVPVLVGAG